MGTKRIQLQGISRDKALDSFGDGECQEIFNLRLRDGQWRVRKNPLKEYGTLGEVYTGLWYHDQDNVGKWIGLLTTSSDTDPEINVTALVVVDPATGSRTTIKEYPQGTTGKVIFLKRFLIFVSDNFVDKYLYKDGAYTIISFANLPKLSFKTSAPAITQTDEATSAEALLGKFRKQIVELNEKWGTLDGGIMLRVAYRLFDGSYVLPTLPIYVEVAPLTFSIQCLRFDSEHYYFALNYQMGYVSALIDRAYYNSFADMKDVISSVAIFASKNERLYKIDDTTITDDLLDDLFAESLTINKDFSSFCDANPNFSKMVDPENWYKVHEISFQDAGDIYKGADEAIEWKGYYLNYAVKEVMPVDNFTYHSVSGNALVFNDRVHYLGTRTTFGKYSNPFATTKTGFTPLLTSLISAFMLVTIRSELGQVYVWNQITEGLLFTRNADGKTCAVFDRKIIGYPDMRAIEAMLVTYDPTTNKYTRHQTFSLQKSLHDNYAYYCIPDFDPTKPSDKTVNYGDIVIILSDGIELNSELYPESPLLDTNRVQVSELRNPFVLSAKNSYQIGTGQIISAGVNTEAMSTGQFGQFPLLVFTTTGVYALEQGVGDVLYASISPVNGDVVTTDSQVVSVSTGVLYVTKRGVFVNLGKETLEISKLIEGTPESSILSNEHFQFFVENPRLGFIIDGIVGRMSAVNFMTYAERAHVGFDKINNEVIFSNSTRDERGDLIYRYSYIYSLETSTWHKIDKVFELFVNNYPYLYGVNVFQGSKNGIYNLGKEAEDSNISVMALTQPQSFDDPGIYKKIDRMVLRAMLKITTGTYFTFAVFASDDLRTWQLITGGQRAGGSLPYQNILCTRTHGSATYYRLLLVGQVHPDTTITGIDLTTVPRLNRKLRP
jgi:hypothetical protein